jgi:cytochrome c oxidase subunit 2
MDRLRVPLAAIVLVAFFALVTILTVIGFAFRAWLPPVASQHGAGVDFVIHFLLITTGIVFVAGHAALGWFVWRFSRGEPATYQPVSQRTEWLWALPPVVFMAVVSEVGVLVLGHPVWNQLYGAVPEDAVIVEVVGKQFEWFVRYPGKDGAFGKTQPDQVHETRNPLGLVEEDPAASDDIVTRGVLRLPVGRSVSVRLRTHDVLHSFAVPAFRVKQDLVPGIVTHTQFTPTKAGEFEIACAELCGLGHYKMRGTIQVAAVEEFEQWLAAQIGWFE